MTQRNRPQNYPEVRYSRWGLKSSFYKYDQRLKRKDGPSEETNGDAREKKKPTIKII